MIEIKHRHTGAVLYTHDNASGMTMRDAAEAAVKSRANLYGADLYGANLYGANLSRANLYGANLYGANLYGDKIAISPLSLSGLHWDVTVTEFRLRIGYQVHAHAAWPGFSAKEIAAMDSKASEFWTANRDMLLMMCAAQAARAAAATTPTI